MQISGNTENIMSLKNLKEKRNLCFKWRSSLENKYILAIDQGTSATKTILFNRKGQVVHRCNRVHKQYYPNPGWVEHDAEEIYKNTLKAIQDILYETKITGQQMMALAITHRVCI